MRATAGFDPNLQGSYYLSRASIQPPESLEREVWPWVDKWIDWYDRALGDEDDDRRDIAGQGFLRLLKQLRTILLQDSVLMMAEFPSHPMWTDPIFHRNDYKAFAEQLRQSISHDIREPEDVQIRRTVPAIADQLSQLRSVILGQIEQNKAEILRKLDSFDDFVQGRVSFVLNPVRSSASLQTTAVAMEAAATAAAAAAAAASSTGTSSGAASANVTVGDHDRELDPGPGDPPRYKLSRTISTVPDLWKEWTVGLGGGPSVQYLEDSYGARWRPSQEERVFFCRRKALVDWIRTRLRERPATEAMVVVMELERFRLKHRMSLSKLIASIKKDGDVGLPYSGSVAN